MSMLLTAHPGPLLTICRALRAAGGRPYLVGGGVRDRLLGRVAKDDDVEVYGLEASAVREALARVGRVDEVGASFAVLKVSLDGVTLDVSLPRRESATGRGHRDFAVAADPSMPLAEAARRRDFTVNALALDPFTGKVHDPLGGLADLQAGWLRASDAAHFSEDPLRALRACRFAAQLGLGVEPSTLALCGRQPIEVLPAERVGQEILGLLRAPDAGQGLRVLRAMWEPHWFPELFALVRCPQDPVHHPEGDVWIHTVLVVEEMRRETEDLALLLAALCHDLGKPATTVQPAEGPKAGRWIAPGHPEAGIAPTRRLLERLAVPTAILDRVAALVRCHLAPGQLYRAGTAPSDRTLPRLARSVNLLDLAALARTDMLGRSEPARGALAAFAFEERVRQLSLETGPPQPILMGRHLLELGLAPGPQMGALLRRAYEAQLEGTFGDLPGALGFARALLDAQPGNERPGARSPDP